MTARILLRKYRDTDFTHVCDIFLQAVRVTASKDYSDRQIAAWSQIDRNKWQQRMMNSEVWIALCMTEVVGFISVVDDYIDLLFVHPDYQRQGIATRLLQVVEHQYPECEFYVDASITAKPFFMRQGYALVKKQRVLSRDEFFTNFLMRKIMTR